MFLQGRVCACVCACVWIIDVRELNAFWWHLHINEVGLCEEIFQSNKYESMNDDDDSRLMCQFQKIY